MQKPQRKSREPCAAAVSWRKIVLRELLGERFNELLNEVLMEF